MSPRTAYPRWFARGATLIVGGLCATGCGSASGHASWVTVWAASPGGRICQSQVHDRTVRSLVQTPVDGQALRLRLDNRRSGTPRRLRVRVAPATIHGNTTAAARTVRLRGRSMIVVPAHRRVRTDQLAIDLQAGQMLAVSIYSPDSGSPRCQVAPVLSYFTAPGAGDAGARRDSRDYPADDVRPWTVWLDEVQVLRGHGHGSIVAVGDSITAGFGLPPPRRWVVQLAHTEAPRGIAVVDAGIPGDGLTRGTFGARSMAARAREATRWRGVRTILLQGGVNDLGAGERAAPIIRALAGAARAAHRRGVTIIGMTVTPFVTYPASRRAPESARLTINRWIRRTHLFDAVVDLDRLLDRGRPGRLDPRYDAGRGVHPNAAGDARILDAVQRALRAAGRNRRSATG